MMYQMIRYADRDQFNDDARRRYDAVKAESTAISYDCWWIVEQVIPEEGESFCVVWSRQDPPELRK